MGEIRKRNRVPAVKRDALIEALVKRLPSEGSVWLVDQRLAWLRMMVQAMDLTYGVSDPIEICQRSEVVKFSPAEQKVAMPSLANTAPLRQPTAEEIASLDEQRYYIDANGHARGPGGKRIKASEFPSGAEFEDERPDGMQDIDSIIWADGTWPASALPPLTIVSA